jgi:serine/threonine-protein kinase
VAVFGSYRQQVLQQQAFEAQQLGQYRLRQRLGSGGMGEVFLAEHVLLRRPCAIKLIRADQTRDPDTLSRFEREVQAMATLTHPNTVEVYDYGRADDGTFYYVMEYLPGLNLEQLVERYGPLPPGRAIHFLRQVCRALREAHGVGLLHRDIKPSNIIACERGGEYDVAKLLDFGLVQETGLGAPASRITLHGTVLGSPPYLSPEQAAGRADLDARADIYSLGGVGYFLLTGQPPFPRETAMEMMLAHAYEPVVPPGELRPGVPGDLQAVLLRCLNKKPDARFASVVALDNALAGCSAAGLWTEELAARWWQEHRSAPETAAHDGRTVALSPTFAAGPPVG